MLDPATAAATLDPELPIIDPHHHLWLQPQSVLDRLDPRESLLLGATLPALRNRARYLLDEFLCDLHSGHNIRATVYMEAGSMYRQNGPAELRSLGEVEFANGMAAIAASRVVTDIAVCAGIVGNVDLRIGDAARAVLEKHIQAAGGRYRGIRASHVAHDPNPAVLGAAVNGIPHLLLDDRFRANISSMSCWTSSGPFRIRR
jgi:predicted TIM-barrel fold metal-dependent hydrolase